MLAVLTIVGSLGEAFARATPDVPRAVQAFSGALGCVEAAALGALAIASLRERRIARRRDSRSAAASSAAAPT